MARYAPVNNLGRWTANVRRASSYCPKNSDARMDIQKDFFQKGLECFFSKCKSKSVRRESGQILPGFLNGARLASMSNGFNGRSRVADALLNIPRKLLFTIYMPALWSPAQGALQEIYL
jgi:hypothetical protein